MSILALAGMLSTAHAGDVMWYVGHSSPASLSDITTLELTMAGLGSSGVDTVTSWPSSLSGYKVIFLVTSADSYSSAETADLQSFTDSGGVLVLVGESTDYTSDYVSVFNSLLSDLGQSSTFDASASYDSGCGWSGTVSNSHTLTAGISALPYAYVGSITTGSAATELIQTYSGYSLVVVEGSVVLAADSNIFDESCTLSADSTTFFENLYNGVCTDPKTDNDKDGYISAACGGPDCDDSDASINPDTLWYADTDRDSYGDPDVSEASCTEPLGFVDNSIDCDDTDPTVLGGDTWYLDADGDGYGTEAETAIYCDASLPGFAESGSDCDDTDPAVNPEADELCDGVDNNCDTEIDEESAVDASTWYLDTDGDGYGDDSDVLISCDQPDAYAASGGDCDDDKANIHPGSDEFCNSFDDDCDGVLDEDVVDGLPWYPDLDEDGYGDDAGLIYACDQPAGYTGVGGDCDDQDATAWVDVQGLANSCDDDASKDEASSGCSQQPAGNTAPSAAVFLLLLGAVMRRRSGESSSPGVD